MRKFQYLLVFSLLISVSVNGQTQRMVLLEQFTQASCPPCATWNPIIENLLNANPDKITAIMYHVSWPGYDPMYNHNPEDVNARVSYYNFNSVPHSVLDGNIFSGSPSGWNINTVNNRYAVPSPFELALYREVPPSNNRIDLTLLIKATEAISAPNLLAFISVIEDITFTTPPGSNGEKHFPNVMKKLLPKKSGAIIPTYFEPGDYIILQSGWEYANVYDPDEIDAVAFVQDKDTKEIHQAVNSSDILFAPPYSTDVEVLEILNISAATCLGNVAPHVTIRNNGANNLTTFDVNYKVNNGAPASYSWNGNLAFLESVTVELDAISVALDNTNSLQVYISNPNGVSDDYPKNDTLTKTFLKAHQLINTLRVVIITDQMPQETTWEITNHEGSVVFSGGPYSQPGTMIQEYYDITETGCYKFTIFDSGGNGLCCENGQGAWGVYDNNTEIAKGGMFTLRDSTYFHFGPYTGFENYLHRSFSAKVYPNPFAEETSVHIILPERQYVSMEMFNALGEKIRTFSFGVFDPGDHTLLLQCNGLPQGLYYLQISTGSGNTVKKLIIH